MGVLCQLFGCRDRARPVEPRMLSQLPSTPSAATARWRCSWGDVRCHKYFQRTNLKNLSTTPDAQSAGLQRHQRSLESPSECAASKWAAKKYLYEPPAALYSCTSPPPLLYERSVRGLCAAGGAEGHARRAGGRAQSFTLYKYMFRTQRCTLKILGPGPTARNLTGPAAGL